MMLAAWLRNLCRFACAVKPMLNCGAIMVDFNGAHPYMLGAVRQAATGANHMPELKVASERQPDTGRRIDTAEKVRRGANAIGNQGRRITTILGSTWTTESGEAEAIESLVRLASAALDLREEIKLARASRLAAEAEDGGR